MVKFLGLLLLICFMWAVKCQTNQLETNQNNQKLFEDSLCGCEDLSPQGGYTCQEQAQYGKRNAEWMLFGQYCYQTCDRCFCVGECICVDIPPDSNFTCAQQQNFGQCDADWMIAGDYCSSTCGRCPCLLEPSGACMQYALNSIPQASTTLQIISESQILSNILDMMAMSGATYLIPSDNAWIQFENQIPNSNFLFQNELLLSEFIQYHVISESLFLVEDLLEEGMVRSSHLGENIMVDLDSNLNQTVVVDNNGRESNILMQDMRQCGSIIHIIDTVLMPSTSSLPFECLQFALGSNEDTAYILDLILEYPNLRQLFQSASSEPHTYFLPTSSAWEQFREELDRPELLFEEEELLAEFIALHIVKGNVEFTQIGRIAETLHLGENLVINDLGETVRGPNGQQANIIYKDTLMCGSIINVIDTVLLPTKTLLPYECILQTLGSNFQTSSLIQLTQNSDFLIHFLENITSSPHTYFIPSRNAWIDLFDGMENSAVLLEEEELLAEIIAYHIIQEDLTINDLIQQGNETTMHLDEPLIISTSDGPEAVVHDINGREAMVLNEDIQVCNSTINVINKVLIPSTTTTPYECLLFAFETIPGIQQFSKLISESQVVKNIIRDISRSPHTYLIPSNSAIEEFISMSINGPEVFNDPEVFETLFQFHVVQNSMSTRELYEAGDIATLLFEEPIEFEYISNFEIQKRQPLDRTSAIIMPDIQICNVTMHIIDHMLFPAITTIQNLLDNIQGGLFRGLVLIPDEPVITFKSLNENLLGEDDDEEEGGEVGGPVPEFVDFQTYL